MRKRKEKMKLWKKIVIGIVIVLVILLIAAYFIIRNMFSQPDIEAAKGTDETIVETDKGEIMGSLEDGVYQYLGIPYAVAKERFTLAEEVEPWDGVLRLQKLVQCHRRAACLECRLEVRTERTIIVRT